MRSTLDAGAAVLLELRAPDGRPTTLRGRLAARDDRVLAVRADPEATRALELTAGSPVECHWFTGEGHEKISSTLLQLTDGAAGGLLLAAKPELVGEERRGAARVRLRTPVRWSSSDGRAGTATAMDLSIKGIRVVGDLEAHESVQVVLALPAGRVALTANLVQHRPRPGLTTTVTRWFFDELDPATSRVLSDFVAEGVRSALEPPPEGGLVG